MNSENKTRLWTDEMLESALLGTLDPGKITELETDKLASESLRLQTEKLQKEIQLIQSGLLSQSEEMSDTATVSDETLALYLDNALDESERSALEAQLIHNTVLLKRLIQLFCETRDLLDPEFTIEIAEKYLAGEQIDIQIAQRELDKKAEARAKAEEERIASIRKNEDKLGRTSENQ